MTSPRLHVVVYDADSVDGIDDQYWCVNGLIHVTYNCETGLEDVHGPCDGSCQVQQRMKAIELAKMIKRWRSKTLQDGKRTLHSQITLGDGVQELIDSGQPIVGARFDRYYAKRSGSGIDYCLGDQHLIIRTDFSHWADPNSPHHQEHSVKLVPCHGSCHREPSLHPDHDAGIINELSKLLP